MTWKLLTAPLLFAASPLVAQPAGPALSPGEALVQVSGTGQVLATPDRAEITTGATGDGTTSERALAASNQVAERLAAALKAAGIAPAQIRSSELRVAPRYRKDKDGEDTDQVDGYRATQQLTTLVSVTAAGQVIDALASAGATDINGPSFSFANDEPLLARARAAAVVKAEAQARDYAAALHLGRLRVIRVSERNLNADTGSDVIVTGSLQRLKRHATSLQPGQQAVTATVWIDYATGP
jgi:uncharacterized protein YggE